VQLARVPDDPVADPQRRAPARVPRHQRRGRHPQLRPGRGTGQPGQLVMAQPARQRGGEGDRVEIGEAGRAAPAVLAGAGLPAYVSGLAIGLGLDRLVMLRKGIPDIRLLRSADGGRSFQMLDLSLYRPVSAHPAAHRDVSVAVHAGTTPEELGDAVRESLGPDASLVEEVTVRSATAIADLPEAARARLGIRPGEVNVLLRVVLRDLDGSVPVPVANALRDRIYDALHHS